MKLNQRYFLNVVFLEMFFKKLGRLGKHCFTKCSKCPISGSIQLQVRSI